MTIAGDEDIAACLPVALRGGETNITRIAAGLSGAGVYRVERHGQVFVLKISSGLEPGLPSRLKSEIAQLVSQAGFAPRIVYADESRRAILSEFVADKGFFPLFGNPATRGEAIRKLAHTIRGVHDLPVPAGATARDAREFLSETWSALEGFSVPSFVGDAVERLLREEPPPRDRDLVLSHNDLNPSNFLYDGEKILLLDWDTAGLSDPFYDLAAAAIFLRMDDDTSLRFISAHDGVAVTTLPPRFSWNCRLVASLCGTLFLKLARLGGHAGVASDQALDATASVSDVYQLMRTGAANIASPDGQMLFGLALVKAGTVF